MNEESYSKPLPVADEASRPFFEGLRKHELVIMRCSQCGRWRLPAAQRCPACWSLDFDWETASGRGEVYTFAIMHHVLHPGFAADAPYNVTTVQLEEGPRFTCNLVGLNNDEITVAAAVVAVYEDVGDDATLLKFRPA